MFHRGSCAKTNRTAAQRCQDVLLRDGFLEKNALVYGCASVRTVFENQRNGTWLLVLGIWPATNLLSFQACLKMGCSGVKIAPSPGCSGVTWGVSGVKWGGMPGGGGWSAESTGRGPQHRNCQIRDHNLAARKTNRERTAIAKLIYCSATTLRWQQTT